MQRLSKLGIDYLQFFSLNLIPHGTFLRHGGMSLGAFSSLNMSFSSGDLKESVEANRSKAQAILGIGQACYLRQEHGTRIVEADLRTCEIADGIMTNRPGVGLVILHADCQAALFFDPIRRAIAAVHCGWRGNVANIYQKTVEAMKKRYETCPTDLRVAISPSLGPQAAQFIHYKKELPEHFLPFKIGECHFDLWAISKMQLLAEGISEQHIEIAQLCTYENQKDYFSYRRIKESGRHATMIMLPAEPPVFS